MSVISVNSQLAERQRIVRGHEAWYWEYYLQEAVKDRLLLLHKASTVNGPS